MQKLLATNSYSGLFRLNLQSWTCMCGAGVWQLLGVPVLATAEHEHKPHSLDFFLNQLVAADKEQLLSALRSTPGSEQTYFKHCFSLNARNDEAKSGNFKIICIEGYLQSTSAENAPELSGTCSLLLLPDSTVDRLNLCDFLIDSSNDMLALVDSNLRYLIVNKRYANMFSRIKESFSGFTIEDCFSHNLEHYRTKIKPHTEICLTGTSSQFQHWVDIPEIGRTYIEMNYHPLLNEHGEVISIAIVGRDRTEAMHSIETLKHQESMLNRTMHIANVGGWYADTSKSAMQWTDEMYRIHEVDRSFVPSDENMRPFLTDEGLMTLYSSLKNAWSGESFDMITSIKTHHGTKKWVRSIGFPLYENNQVVAIEGILQDLTELTNARLQLQQSEEKYRSLVEETNALLWEADFQSGQFSYMSPQAYQLTGYCAEQWCKETLDHSFIHINDRPHVLQVMNQALQAQDDFVLEYRITRADNSVMWVHNEVKVIFDEAQSPSKLRGIMFDISPMKEMQAGLNRALRSLENHKYILDKHAIIAITNINGHISHVNENFVEICGYEREELLGRNISLLKSGIHNSRLYQEMWLTVSSGQVWQGEICNKAKDNRIFWVYTTLVPLTDEQGKTEEYIAVMTDITSLKQTEESLRRVQKMEAIGQLTGGIAHDFNNLLGIIIGNLELIEMTLPRKEMIASQLENAKNAAMRGSVLTRRLLNFSLQTPVTGKTFNLNNVLLGIEVLISKSLTAMVKIEMDLSDDLWEVEADSGDFEDVMINLAINASDAMPQGGKLFFTTRNTVVRHMQFKQNCIIPPGKYVEISVSDTGSGMNPDVLEKIFEPYFTTKPSDKGSGLGLAMVYSFVQRSKGLIYAESEVEIGTHFTIFLPRAKKVVEKAIQSQIQPQQPVMATANETILVVDDEADIVKMTRTNLENLGYRVITAFNASQALSILESGEHIDLMFSDVVMPGELNGFELAEKAMQIRPALKVLFTTGYAKVQTSVTREQWANRLLPKPYRNAELSQKIRDALDESNI